MSLIFGFVFNTLLGAPFIFDVFFFFRSALDLHQKNHHLRRLLGIVRPVSPLQSLARAPIR